MIRGDTHYGGPDAVHKFMLCYLQNGELIAAESVNNPREFMACRQLVASRDKLDPAKLADSETPIKDAVQAS